ncbi:Polycomb-like protein [Phytophthora cinnamomi]|uniref:Polycomb-like protein n=1 Tax=Phytophthora cinnamomi TaxID=4785 RepID=UPI003559C54C|nr:Polycomb-like protein [Phytophthora cinnamomi]
MKTEVIDVTEDAASASDASSGRKRAREAEPAAEDAAPAPARARRTHRKTESRVLFSEVMAQEREMERLSYEKSRASSSSSAPPLRKGETAESPAKRSKQKRAEERRSARQKLRRTLSPRSPDGGPQPRALRAGVTLPALDGAASARVKRRFARDEDAIQDATLHSTAWRHLRVDAPPANLLPDREGVLPPYALPLDAPLEAFDAALAAKCRLSAHFLRPKPLSMASGSLAQERDKTLVDARVQRLLDEAAPAVKKCHAARANAVLANTRQQIAAYLEQRPVIRDQTMALSGLPLQVSKLEKVAARRLLRDAEFAPDGMARPHYSVGRTEADHAGHIYPETVTYLSKIAPIPRSTTCMLARGTHRVEDDPIIRFVPYFSAAKNKPPEFTSADRCKDTLVGMDDEINEYVLRYVVSQCGGGQDVFEALQRCGAFTQPFANYSDILERVTREELYKQQVQELEVRRNSEGISSRKKRAIDSLLKECFAVRNGAYLRGRLQPLPSHVVVNHLQESATAVETMVESSLFQSCVSILPILS